MMSAEEIQAFCRTAVDQGYLSSDQVQAFTAQSEAGIQSPGAYFMLSSILEKAQVDRVNELMRQTDPSSGVTRLLKEEDTVFHLPPMASAETTGEDTKVIDVSDADLEPEKKPDSGIVDVDGILDMDDTALQLQTMQDDEGDQEGPPQRETDTGFNLLEMDDAALQGSGSEDDNETSTIRHVSPSARAFCEAAVSKGLITSEQAREFEQQADGGFKDPGTFFMLSGGLTETHVEAIRKGLPADREGPTKKLLRSDDSVLELPPVEDKQEAGSYVAEEVPDPHALVTAKPEDKTAPSRTAEKVGSPPPVPDVQPPIIDPPAIPRPAPAKAPVPGAPQPAAPLQAGLVNGSLVELGRGSIGFGAPGGRIKVLGNQSFVENELPLFLVNVRNVSGNCISAPGHGGLYRTAGQPAVCWWTETKSDPSNPSVSRLDFHIEGIQVSADADWVAYKVKLT